MSIVKPSDSDENLLEPLLQQKDADDNDNVIIKESWMSPCTNGKNNSNKFENLGTNSKNNKNPLNHCKKPVISNSANTLFSRRKRTMAILAVVFLFLFYMNSMLMNRNSDERIPVIHHSHVPGMKALKIFAPIATTEQRKSTTVAVTLKPEKTTRSARSTSSNKSLQSTAMPSLATTTPHRVVTTTTTAPTKTNIYSNLSTTISTNSTILPPSGYLVWSDKCKMPNIDPYTPEVMKYFKREKYEPCSESKPLTRVIFNSTSNKYVLLINEDQVKYYTKSGGQLDCCYQVIERKSGGKKPDVEVGLSECLSFRSPMQLPNTADNILVKCKSKKKQTYSNGHPMMPERPEIRKRLNDWKLRGSAKPVSVLMIGIDSISRVNLIRAMPKTAQYLYDNEWFEMSGYNKMDDNTFPNLMAILTGYNQTTAFHSCTPTKVGALDRCPFIWKSFREHGYVTAYAEDESGINTFNYLKAGFEKPPVDYYFRPFLISAEHNLTIKRKSNLIFCLGFQHSADYIYDYAIELATRYRDDPYFGLFWTNTFSHNAISDCSSMDDKMVDYLKQFAKRGILDQSIVIFFSDHGMRFGPTRKFLSGHLEERLPFMFIWLPPGLKNSHPEFVNALSVNKNRLTNPYDLHMTLKHILELTGRTEQLPPAQDCPKCQTLLKPVPHSRSCDDVAIEDHWCTCIPYSSIYKGSNIVKKIAKFTINYINDYVAEYKNGSVADKCVVLSLSEIQSAYRALHAVGNASNVTIETYRIIFITKPNDALFEATVRYRVDTDTMEVTGNISRLNSYASDSHCVLDGGAKKYCSCGKGPGNHHAAARAPG